MESFQGVLHRVTCVTYSLSSLCVGYIIFDLERKKKSLYVFSGIADSEVKFVKEGSDV